VFCNVGGFFFYLFVLFGWCFWFVFWWFGIYIYCPSACLTTRASIIEVSRNLLGLERTHELLLFVSGLETSMAKLGGSVDELQGDLLGGIALGLGDESLAHGDAATLDTRAGTLDHEVVLVHLTVVREATQRGDALHGEVELGGGVGLSVGAVGSAHTIGDLVHLFVQLGTVVITVLTSTCHRVLDTGRMPRSDTCHLAQTLVSLARKLGHTPAGDDTLETLTLGNGDGIDHLILLEHTTDANSLLEEARDVLDFVVDGTTIDLDLTDVSLLLPEAHLGDRGVADSTKDGAVFSDALLLLLDTCAISVLLGVLGKGLLLLGSRPVLVEATLALVVEMLSPDGAEGL